MDKKEALEIAVKLFEVCKLQEDCPGCPFEDTFDDSNKGGLCLVSCLLDDACIKNGDKYKRVKEKLSKSNKASEQNDNMIHGDIFDMPKENYITRQDNVNHPSHYCKGGLECIQVIKVQLTPEQYKGYLYGNVIKYMWRWPNKNGLEDVKKAAKYLDWLKEELEKE